MSVPTSYDIVPYPTGSQVQTHPDRLATIATLFGMSPAPVEECRVLEIACGNGGNLIPMAYGLPRSTFVGIDLSARAIDAGRAVIQRLELRNISLLHQDLRTLPSDFGTFDYIIAHGVYAWVAPPVQDWIMAVCRGHLAPQGVAFVSYNAFPGSHLRVMVRDMLNYHIRDISDPEGRLVAAKAFLDFLRRSWPDPSGLRHCLGQEAESVLHRSRDTLYHDELNVDYQPAYFHQFVAHAARHRLQYLGETDFHEMTDAGISPEAREAIQKLGPDRFLEREQYLDFLKCRAFRQTLLCRQEIPLRREISLATVERFHVGTRAKLLGRDPHPGEEIEYRSPRGGTMTASDPAIHRIMGRLERAWPRGIPFGELRSGELDPADLAGFVMRLAAADVVELRLRGASYSVEPGERPEASRVARLQLEQHEVVTNLRHADVSLADKDIRKLLLLLDGTRDRAALIRDLEAAGIPISPDGLESVLQRLGQSALLVA